MGRPDRPSACGRTTSPEERCRAVRLEGIRAAELLHEARHTFASLATAAGLNAKALSVYMGPASIAFALDRYGHLFPGKEEEAAGLLDAPGSGVRASRRGGAVVSFPPQTRIARHHAYVDTNLT
jgi:hypothetical protein